MNTAAIYNVWDGVELLGGSIKTIADHVDHIIIVLQSVSNFGEAYDPLDDIEDIFRRREHAAKLHLLTYDPNISAGGSINESNKRNIGIEKAKQLKCSHFLHMDVDEYYEDFGAAKKEYIKQGYAGSVCPIYTYFKKPTWRLENLDGYYVPFIHELRADTKAGRSSYPYLVDPTRTINESDVIKISHPMHHFSWVRKDIERKARNSSAGQHGNKLKGLLADYHALTDDVQAEGYVIKDMGGQKLINVHDLFGIL